MRNNPSNRLVVLATGGLALLSLAGIAATSMPIVAGSIADPAVRDRISHGPGNCQTALPVFDGNIRKRPMAIANEGSGTAFVTCDFTEIDNGGTSIELINVFVLNQAGAAGATVRCTLVDGVAIQQTPLLFMVRDSASMAVGESSALSWTAGDNGDTYYTAPALSCSLPAGVAIVGVRSKYLEDVGV